MNVPKLVHLHLFRMYLLKHVSPAAPKTISYKQSTIPANNNVQTVTTQIESPKHVLRHAQVNLHYSETKTQTHAWNSVIVINISPFPIEPVFLNVSLDNSEIT